MACWLASLTFAGPGQWLSGRGIQAVLWFAGELALVGLWLLTGSKGNKWPMVGATAALGLYHLAGWVSAARAGWRFHKVILESSVSRILVMAALVFVAPLPAVMLVYGPGRTSLATEYGISEGSMATALLGQHANLRCQRCGYEFAVGLPVSPKDYIIGEELRCPMCGNCDFGTNKGKFLRGDRILTSKRLVPKRWDLLLFRSPTGLTDLLLKRVVGLEGEELEIIDGDIFINSQLVSKPAMAYEEMWLTVNDTKYRAKRTHHPKLQWRPGKKNQAQQMAEQGWLFEAAKDSGQSLELNGELTDAMIYNINSIQYIRPEPIHDVRLEVNVSKLQGHGELNLVWEHAGTKVLGILETNGQARLRIEWVGQDRPSDTTVADGRHNRANTKLMLIVRDGYAYLYANGKELCQRAVGPFEAQIARYRVREACRLKITANNCQGKISRIRLDRDVHYRAVHPQAVRISPGHYYVLGDNSAVSSDSRLGWRMYPGLAGWDEPRLVPAEFTEGVVTWLYWPLARMRSFR